MNGLWWKLLTPGLRLVMSVLLIFPKTMLDDLLWDPVKLRRGYDR